MGRLMDNRASSMASAPGSLTQVTQMQDGAALAVCGPRIRDPGSVQLGQLDHGRGQNAGRGALAHIYGRAGQVIIGGGSGPD
jgi:hypothetical protein